MALLDDPGNAHFIAWTGRGMEFKLIEPEEVSGLARVDQKHVEDAGLGLELQHASTKKFIERRVRVGARRGANVSLIRRAGG